MQGTIFNIQHYSVHDGPGIRTVVFFKGCALRCRWCANPESQKFEKELCYKEKNCIGGECLRCQMVCGNKAIFYKGYGSVEVKHSKCIQCQKCVEVCPANALTTFGETKTVEEIMKEVVGDKVFYRQNGGLTLSGGEVLLQGEFAKALLQAAKDEGIRTAIETCGYASWEIAKEVFALCDYILYDIKSLNDERHRAYTGISNQVILENFKKLVQTYPSKKIRVRTPVIPGFNDTDEDIDAIKSFLAELSPMIEYELLKYHKYGENKYHYLGRTYPMGETTLSDEKFEALKKSYTLLF